MQLCCVTSCAIFQVFGSLKGRFWKRVRDETWLLKKCSCFEGWCCSTLKRISANIFTLACFLYEWISQKFQNATSFNHFAFKIGQIFNQKWNRILKYMWQKNGPLESKSDWSCLNRGKIKIQQRIYQNSARIQPTLVKIHSKHNRKTRKNLLRIFYPCFLSTWMDQELKMDGHLKVPKEAKVMFKMYSFLWGANYQCTQ